MNHPQSETELPALTVLYDGACPLCKREIAMYQGMEARETLCFADISAADTALPPDTTRAQLLQRFHVRSADGSLHSGAAAFVLLWATLPGWRWLARLARWPGMLWLMERGYRFFLRFRPQLQKLAARAERRQAR